MHVLHLFLNIFRFFFFYSITFDIHDGIFSNRSFSIFLIHVLTEQSVLPNAEEAGEAIIPEMMEGNVTVKRESSRLQLDAYPSLVSIVCGVCKKDFPVERSIAERYLAGEPYTCDICQSRSEKKLRLHKLLHSGAFPKEARPQGGSETSPVSRLRENLQFPQGHETPLYYTHGREALRVYGMREVVFADVQPQEGTF